MFSTATTCAQMVFSAAAPRLRDGQKGSIPFDPATFRIFIEFTESEGQVRGSSSVAVTTVPIFP